MRREDQTVGENYILSMWLMISLVKIMRVARLTRIFSIFSTFWLSISNVPLLKIVLEFLPIIFGVRIEVNNFNLGRIYKLQICIVITNSDSSFHSRRLYSIDSLLTIRAHQKKAISKLVVKSFFQKVIEIDIVVSLKMRSEFALNSIEHGIIETL